MEYKIYICRKRAKFKAICGQVNIRYGTILNCQGGFLILNDLPVPGACTFGNGDHPKSSPTGHCGRGSASSGLR